MKLQTTGEAASFRFNIYVPLNGREKDNICQIIILISYRPPVKLHWIAIENVSWKAKQKVK